MKKTEFKSMWEKMQEEGYFANHPHYADHFGSAPSEEELLLDSQLLALDFTAADITMPVPYSDTLERSIKRTESIWLYEMFDLPRSGTALDVGCGFGRSVSWMARLYDQVLATDISEKVLSVARENCKELQNIRFYSNDSNSLPADIGQGTVDVAYVFTVFQHIPREFTAELLGSVRNALKADGTVVFNLLSNINEDLNAGVENTEWAIGYSEQQALELLKQSGLRPEKIVRWSRPETEVCWLWIAARVL